MLCSEITSQAEGFLELQQVNICGVLEH